MADLIAHFPLAPPLPDAEAAGGTSVTTSSARFWDPLLASLPPLTSRARESVAATLPGQGVGHCPVLNIMGGRIRHAH
jgi:hypothetical protein